MAGTGLVVMNQYKGVTVGTVDAAMAREVYDVRLLLEPEARHFHPPGAIEVARMTARALASESVLGARDLRRLNAEIAESWLTWHEEP